MREALSGLAARQRGQNVSLLLQRYLDRPAIGGKEDPEKKRNLLEAAIVAANDAARGTLYKTAYQRREDSLRELTEASDFETAGRLIVGLGSENVIETGIRLHHTYGLPVIPGSALKGIAAHYCHEVWGKANSRFLREADDYHRLLFGTTEDGGCVVFHDAWLKPDSRDPPLAMDVMTPHHPDWLNGAKPPTDFDSPRPVPFVSVSGTFRVAVSWRGPLDDNEQRKKWTELAFDLLAEALREWGVGGKTSSGYGRLAEVEGNRRKAFSAEALGLPAAGTTVSATLLKAPKRRDQPWRAEITLRTGQGRSGPVEPIERTPADAAPGKVVEVVVASVDEKSIRFTWPK